MGPPHTVSKHLGGRVLIAAGDTIYDEPFHVTDPIGDGLRIVVVLNGAMTLRAGDAPTIDVSGPTNVAVFSEGTAPRDQTFREGTPFRYVLVQADRELVLAESGFDPEETLRRSPGRRDTAQLVLNTRKADPASEAVAAQILACPEAREFDLYRLSKALELIALVLDGFDIHRSRVRPGRLSPADAGRISAARDLLLASFLDPPDITLLAQQAGVNATKLNRGFRTLYGMTPYALLQEHRLQMGYRLLASGRRTVGQAAAETGYTQSHFATLFRKRFGVAPSSLLPRSDPSH